MSINRFPLKYKNWYWYLIFFVNSFIPFLMFFSSFSKDVSKMQREIPIVALSFFIVFFIMTVIYVWATCREHRLCARIFKKHVDNFKNFQIGIFCTFFSLIIYLPIIFLSAKGIEIKIVGYVFSGITLVLGIISNVFLNIYEFKLGFIVFYEKYKDSLFEDIVKSIRKRKKNK